MLVFILQFVIVSLSGWGLLIFGGYKAFSGGKKEEVLTTNLFSYRTFVPYIIVFIVNGFDLIC